VVWVVKARADVNRAMRVVDLTARRLFMIVTSMHECSRREKARKLADVPVMEAMFGGLEWLEKVSELAG
jgi:hypothetical protein